MESSSTSAPESPSPNIVRRQPTMWPVLACGLGMTILAAFGFTIMEYRWFGNASWMWLAETVVVSCLLAEIALATIVGGLFTRHWVTGWLMAVGLACLQTCIAVIISEVSSPSNSNALQHLALCSLWPVFFLSTCAPLVMLRTLCGWTLVRQTQPAIPRWRSSLEDLILVGVIIACSITTSQMFLFSEGPQSLPQLLAVMAMFAATSLICIPPVVYVTFRSRNWTRRILGWLVLSVIAFAVIFVESGLMEGSGYNYSFRFFIDMLVGNAASTLTMAVGLIALMASGYQLTYFERSTKNSASLLKNDESDLAALTAPAPGNEPADVKAPFEAEWLDDSQPKSESRTFQFTPQWQARSIALLMVCVAALGGLGIHFSKLQSIRFYEELAQPTLKNVRFTKSSVQGLHFGPEFVDSDLKKYLKYRDTIDMLSFAGTKITDAMLPELSQFPRLKELDLSGTLITDAGLQQLKLPVFPIVEQSDFLVFTRLSLADTKVTWAGVQAFAKRTRVVNLDLSGLQITDENLATPLPVTNLRLSRNPITDEGLSQLVKRNAINNLDVSDTNITGSTLDRVRCPTLLNLDGTAVNDATLIAILKTGRVRQVSLRRTNVTAAVLPLLVNRSVRLGKGLITERDLAIMGRAYFQHLALNDQQFTGQCMTIGTLTTDSLDLSGSSVTDDVLMALGSKGRSYQFLGLANTQVTDGCMPYLARMTEIDLRGTRVTVLGLGARPMNRLVISHNQFSPKELMSLQNTNLEFTERPMFSHWPD